MRQGLFNRQQRLLIADDVNRFERKAPLASRTAELMVADAGCAVVAHLAVRPYSVHKFEYRQDGQAAVLARCKPSLFLA